MRIMQQPPSGLALSIEEAAILSDEIGQDLKDMGNSLTAATTVGDVSAIYADSKSIEKDFDYAETLAVSDMAAAAVKSVLVVDYTPTFGLAAEGFSDQAAEIWKKIVELLRRAWQFLKNFFQRMFSYRGYLRHRLQMLSEKVEGLSEDPIAPKPVINVPMRDGKIFTVPGKKLIDTATFGTILKDIFKTVRLNFKLGPVATKRLGEAFMDSINAMTPQVDNPTLQKLFAEKIIPAFWLYFDAYHIKDFKRGSIDSHITNTFTATSPPIAGSCRAEFTWGSSMNQFFIDRGTEEPMSHVIRDLLSARCQLVQEISNTPSTHLTMPAFKVQGMKAALNEVNVGLELIDEFEKNFNANNEDFSKRFEQIAADVSRRFQGAGEDSHLNRTTFNMMLNLPVVYSHLAAQPITDLTKRTLGTLEAVLNMVDKSIAMYKPKAA